MIAMSTPRCFIFLDNLSKILNNMVLVITLQFLLHRLFYYNLFLPCISCHLYYQVPSLALRTY